MSKFSPHLTWKTKPLHNLLSTKNQWFWGDAQEKAFRDLKESLSSNEVLAKYDPACETVISANASSYRLGEVLRLKQPNGNLRPVTYASRALTTTKQRYAQIEKEALAIVWACERFQSYIIGLHFYTETDHKPLVHLLSCKNLDEKPIRVQHFRLRLMRFEYSISHVPGKNLTTADTLSRSPVSQPSAGDEQFQQEVKAFLDLIVRNVPATEKRLQDIQWEQDKNVTCRELKRFCQPGWPNKSSMKGALKLYAQVMDEFSFHRGLLLRGSRLVVPSSLCSEILQKLHFDTLAQQNAMREPNSQSGGPAYAKSWMTSLASVQCAVHTNNSQPSLYLQQPF